MSEWDDALESALETLCDNVPDERTAAALTTLAPVLAEILSGAFAAGQADERMVPPGKELERVAELEQQNARLETAIRWALGESPEGLPEFDVVGDGNVRYTTTFPRYAWRTTLRELSGVEYVPPTTGEQE